MKIHWSDLDKRAKSVEEIARDLPSGTFVVCASINATDSKKNVVYRVVKHFAPGTRITHYEYEYENRKRVGKKPVYNTNWETQLTKVIDVDLTCALSAKKSRKSNVSTAVLFPVDLIALCSARAQIDRVIQEYVRVGGQLPIAPEEELEEEETEDVTT